MSSRNTIFTKLFSAAIFIFMEVAALGMLSQSTTVTGQGTKGFIASVRMVLWSWSEDVRYYTSLKQANQSLAEENFRLSEQLRAYKAFEAAQEYAVKQDFEDFIGIPAAIVKQSTNTQHNYIIINKGSEDGVRPESGIVSSNGVVGVVDAVMEHYSYAISFLNTSISISSRIGQDGDVGALTWSGGSSAKGVVHNIPVQSKFEKGDTLWTSGYSSIFPAGIPLGVLGDSRVIDGVTLDIDVNLFQNPSSLRFVKVLVNEGADEIEDLEYLEQEGRL